MKKSLSNGQNDHFYLHAKQSLRDTDAIFLPDVAAIVVLIKSGLIADDSNNVAE